MTRKHGLAITEAELQENVVELAQWLGYQWIHIRPAQRRDDTWYVPYQGDTGFPDLMLVHKQTHRMILAELKSEDGRTTREQWEWIDAAGDWGFVWRPSDWLDGTIEGLLKKGASGR